MIRPYLKRFRCAWSQGLLIFLAFSGAAFGQYSVGDTLKEQELNIPVVFCANGSGEQILGELLQSAAGEPDRILWLNLFASW